VSYTIDYYMWGKILETIGISSAKRDDIYYALEGYIWGLNCEFTKGSNHPLVRHYNKEGEKVDEKLLREEFNNLRFAYYSAENFRKYKIKDATIDTLDFPEEIEKCLQENKITTVAALLWAVDGSMVSWDKFPQEYVSKIKEKAEEIKQKAAREESMRLKIQKSREELAKLNLSVREKAMIIISRAPEAKIREIMPKLEALSNTKMENLDLSYKERAIMIILRAPEEKIKGIMPRLEAIPHVEIK